MVSCIFTCTTTVHLQSLAESTGGITSTKRSEAVLGLSCFRDDTVEGHSLDVMWIASLTLSLPNNTYKVNVKAFRIIKHVEHAIM